ncbi:hypothetical protein DTW89_11315, partial [Acidovorax sp. BoFeN1]
MDARGRKKETGDFRAGGTAWAPWGTVALAFAGASGQKKSPYEGALVTQCAEGCSAPVGVAVG